MRVIVWCGVIVAGLVLITGCGSQYHSQYGPSDGAMIADSPRSTNNVRTASQANSRPAVFKAAMPFMAIAGMSPGLVMPVESETPYAASPAKPAPPYPPVYMANNTLTPPAPERPVTMTKIDPVQAKPQKPTAPVANTIQTPPPADLQRQLVYPAGGMFMYQAGKTPPANRNPKRYYVPQNRIPQQTASQNINIDAIVKQAANYKRVYSVTSGEYFDPKTNKVIRTIQ